MDHLAATGRSTIDSVWTSVEGSQKKETEKKNNTSARGFIHEDISNATTPESNFLLLGTFMT